MPLVRFELKNEYGLADPDLYRVAAKREDPKPMLDGVAVAGLVGILRQLGDLAEFAADVFHDLHEQVIVTAARGRKVLNRVQNIETALPSLEKAVKGQSGHLHFAYLPGSDWHSHIRTEQSIMLNSDLPPFMMDLYEECRDPPRLYLLDKYDNAGAGACLKRYSDPLYFRRMWDTSNKEKSENARQEKRVQKVKRKGSNLTKDEFQRALSSSLTVNGEFQRVLSASHRSSRRFPSQSTEEEGIPEIINSPDRNSNADIASSSTSAASQTRMNCAEQLPPSKFSTIDTEDRYDKQVFLGQSYEIDVASSSVPYVRHSGEGSFDALKPDYMVDRHVPDSPPRVDVVHGENSTHHHGTNLDNFQEVPPSVPTSSEDTGVHHPSDERLELRGIASGSDSVVENSENQSVIQASVLNYSDKVVSDADSFMDALNTLETETDTEPECQTTARATTPLSVSTQVSHVRASQSPAQNSDFSECIKSFSTSHPTVVQCEATCSPRRTPSESLNQLEPPQLSGLSLDGCCSDIEQVPESDAGLESRENIVENVQSALPQPNTNGVHIQTADENPEQASEKQISAVLNSSGISSTKLWTNADLFGLEPSKPPVVGALNVTNEELVGGHYRVRSTMLQGLSPQISNETTPTGTSVLSTTGKSQVSFVHNSYDVEETAAGGLDNAPIPTSFIDNKHNLWDGGLRTQIEPANDNSLHSDVQCLSDLPMASKSQAEEGSLGHGTMNISATFSSIAQRFLANTLQRKNTITYSNFGDPSRMVNHGRGDLNESSIHAGRSNAQTIGTVLESPLSSQDKHKSISPEPDKMRFPNSYSGKSSPPLELMKISFHPMNASEVSKVTLELSEENGDENAHGLILPAFQLPLGSSHCTPESGSESEDDTFCQSYTYSSDELLSPNLYANSEVWELEHGDILECDQYDDSHRMLRSKSNVSNRVEVEQLAFSDMDMNGGLEKVEVVDRTVAFKSASVVGLPTFDLGLPMSDHRNEEHDSFPSEQANLIMHDQNEMPPPPPLPPVKWRMTRTNKNNNSCDTFNKIPEQHPASGDQQEKVASEGSILQHPPGNNNELHDNCMEGNRELDHSLSVADMIRRHELQIRAKSEHPELREEKLIMRSNTASKDVDEREDLLHQIRNKSFNLRRTVQSKPSEQATQATADPSVAAILKKANAIRLAFAGSEDGGDDDSWSDV